MTETHQRDLALVERLLAGDESALDEFFAGHVPRLYRFALARLDCDADAAEEAVQATLVKVVPKLSGYRGEAALFTWLCTACRRQIWDSGRRARRGGKRVELVEEVTEVRRALELLAADVEADPERRLLRDELARWVQVLLDHLPGRYGDALEWKYVDGLSVREIGVRLGTGRIAAQSLLARARAAFREAFEAVPVDLALDPERARGGKERP